MSRAVLTAVTDSWEGALVRALEQGTDLEVVRRCADLPDLLAAAASGLAKLALVSADVRGLDRSAVEQMRTGGASVVGVFAPGDERSERHLRQLGVDDVFAADAAGAVLQATLDAVSGPGALPARPTPRGTQHGGHPRSPAPPSSGLPAAGRPAAGPDDHTMPEIDDDELEALLRTGLVEGISVDGISVDGISSLPAALDDAPRPLGVVVAVWGPTGAPGRTTVAVNLATELARLGRTTVLVDADTYGGSVAQVLSLLDEAPGLAAATRSADHGTLDLPALARLAPEVSPGLRVLTGIPKAERWPELRAAAMEHVLALTRRLAEFTVVDCGFGLEDDEELSYDTLAPRRNATTLTTLETADHVIAVGAADPIGLQRLVRGLQELAATPSPDPIVLVNRVRASAVGPRPEQRIREALQRFAGVTDPVFVPDDRDALDAALLAGRALAEQAMQSPARQAVLALAARLAQTTAPARTRRRWRR